MARVKTGRSNGITEGATEGGKQRSGGWREERKEPDEEGILKGRR